MESNQLAIKVTPRVIDRKSSLKNVRKKNFVPGIVYGRKQKNIPLSLDVRVIEKYSKREYENKIFTLQSDDKALNGLKVIKKAVTFHPTRRRPIHIDFLSLDMSQALKVNVEIRFEGKPKGVKEQGGIFNPILRTIEVECLPEDIPNHIPVDVANIELNQNLHVSDISIPSNLKLITKTTQTLCAVVEVKEEVATPGTDATTVTSEGVTPAEGTEGTTSAGAATESDKKPSEPSK